MEHGSGALPLVSTSGGTDVCAAFVGWVPGMLKRILQGAAPGDVLSLGAVDEPGLIGYYTDLARRGPGTG